MLLLPLFLLACGVGEPEEKPDLMNMCEVITMYRWLEPETDYDAYNDLLETCVLAVSTASVKSKLEWHDCTKEFLRGPDGMQFYHELQVGITEYRDPLSLPCTATRREMCDQIRDWHERLRPDDPRRERRLGLDDAEFCR